VGVVNLVALSLCLRVTTRKKVVNFWGEEKCTTWRKSWLCLCDDDDVRTSESNARGCVTKY